MQLEGKCKELFEEWLYHDFNCDKNYLEMFVEDRDSMQWGVYQDFFDSIGLRIYLEEKGMIEYQVVFMEWDGDRIEILKLFKTRPEARTAAIQKAMELINQREV